MAAALWDPRLRTWGKRTKAAQGGQTGSETARPARNGNAPEKPDTALSQASATLDMPEPSVVSFDQTPTQDLGFGRGPQQGGGRSYSGVYL